jgi:hypothetical protein
LPKATRGNSRQCDSRSGSRFGYIASRVDAHHRGPASCNRLLRATSRHELPRALPARLSARRTFATRTASRSGGFKTAWESLLLIADGHDTKRAKPGARVDRAKLQQIDLHWHDLRHEGACRLLADGVDIRIIQLMLGHASVQQTQRYLNVTDEELRRGVGNQLEATDAETRKRNHALRRTG